MPPRRRTTGTPQPKGRRPKVAGTGPAARGPDSETEIVASAKQSESIESSASGDAPPAEAASVESPAVEVPLVESPAAEGGSAEVPTETAEQSPKTINRTSSLRPRETAVAEAAADASVDAVDEAVAEAAWKRVVALGMVAVALGAVALIAAIGPGADVPNQAWVDTSETAKVTADAKNAIQTLYTYKFDTVDQDFDHARAVLGDSMREEFDRTATVTRDAVVQTKTATSAEVTDIGLKLLSDDRAELVASMNVSATNDGAAQGSAQGPLSVTMEKSGDNWLITDIRDR